jgi:hypothetical protein
MRQEFGFVRNSCSCRKCSVFCEFIPGFLVPSDLDRLIPPGDDPLLWAEQHLLASPGYQIKSHHVTVISIPSLVPRRQGNGHCHWLQDGRCSVHENSPYACAFHNQCRQTDAQAEKIGIAGREARAKAFKEDGLYAQLWRHLWAKGLRELTSTESMKRVREELVGIVRAEERIERAEGRKKRRKEKKAARRRKK